MAVSPSSVLQMHQLALCKHALVKIWERDQKKWIPVFRPIALQKYKWRMILSPNRGTLRRIMRNGLSTLKIRVKRRLSI
jgi:hypothetical protein